MIFKLPKNKIHDVFTPILNKHYKSITKDELVIYTDLITKTYYSFGLQITDEDIYEQAANIIFSFAVSSSISGKNNIIDDIPYKIEAESEKLVDLCLLSLSTQI